MPGEAAGEAAGEAVGEAVGGGPGRGSGGIRRDDGSHELMLRELGRLNSELCAQRRHSAATLHDLAGPTQVVLGLAELLLDSATLDPESRVRLKQLQRSATTMAGLVGELGRGFELDDTARLELRRLDLVALVTSVVERTRVIAAVKDIEVLLLVEQPRDRGCWVEADALKIERALSNLLGNAIKFSPAGSTVSVALDRGVDDALVAVQDEGPGIGAEVQERIFEVYQRGPEQASEPGQGLGLFITRRILEGHGGRVSVRSAPGHGATFLMEVPLAPEPAYAERG